MIYIVGIGPGDKKYILPYAIEILQKCNLIIGFKRALTSINFIKNKQLEVKSLKQILEIINEQNTDIAIVASGDPCFYGISEYIKRNFLSEIKIIPGLSSFQYLTSKIGESWQDSYLGSLHGREDEFIQKVTEYKKSIWLTDKKNNPVYLCDLLEKNNISAEIVVGENLSYDDERIIRGSVKDFKELQFSGLTVMLIKTCY